MRKRRGRASVVAIGVGRCQTIILAILVAFLGSGCSVFDDKIWSPAGSAASPGGTRDRADKSGATNLLQHHRTSTLTHASPDTISLAVDFRHVPSSLLGETMWRRVDETAFDAGIRQAWLDNGLRIGLIFGSGDSAVDKVTSPPNIGDAVNELFAPAEMPGSEVSGGGALGAEFLAGRPDGREVIPLRPSRRHELPLGPALSGPQTILLKQTAGVVGMQLDNPQFLLAMTAESGPRQGQSTLQIRPEIQHGAIRQKFVSSDSAVRIQTGRDRWSLGEMDLIWTTHPGSILVIAPVLQNGEAEATFGLGRQVLRDPDHLNDDQHIVTFLQIQP